MEKTSGFLTAKQVAELDFVPWKNVQTIIRKAQTNQIPAYKFGKQWFFRSEQLSRTFINAGANGLARQMQIDDIKQVWSAAGAEMRFKGLTAADVPQMIEAYRQKQKATP